MNSINKLLTGSALAVLTSIGAASAGYTVIGDGWFAANPAAHLTTASEWVMQGTCYVRPGNTLTIDSGVVIRGIPGFGGTNPSTLIICRGAQIFANGTVNKPIIMTTTADDLSNPFDFGPGARGIAGGIVICGWSKIAENDLLDPAHFNGMTIEGIPTPTSFDKAGGIYVANGDSTHVDDNDNSGSLTYLSIRYAGSCPETGKEINGLSLYGVGAGTTIHHVEVYGSDDDGIECFGGTVNLKYCVAAYGNDDDLDLDDGYRGKVQFFFSIKNAQSSVFGTPDHGFENSGCAKNQSLTYNTNPTIYNWTSIGAGKTAVLSGSNGDVSMMMNQRMAGTYRNGIFIDWPKKATNIDSAWSNDAKQMLLNGSLSIKKVFWWDIGAGSTWAAITSHGYEADSLSAYNYIKDPKLRGISREVTKRWLDPRPQWTSPACSTGYWVAAPVDGFFSPVTFCGAFSRLSTEYWIRGWTCLDRDHMTANLLSINPTVMEGVTNGNSQFDLQFKVGMPFADGSLLTSDPRFNVMIDANNVTAPFLSRAGGIVMSAWGGVIYKVPTVKLNEYGTSVGIHRMTACFPMSNGLVLTDTAWVRTIQ
jgi:hypothetical protein